MPGITFPLATSSRNQVLHSSSALFSPWGRGQEEKSPFSQCLQRLLELPAATRGGPLKLALIFFTDNGLIDAPPYVNKTINTIEAEIVYSLLFKGWGGPKKGGGHPAYHYSFLTPQRRASTQCSSASSLMFSLPQIIMGASVISKTAVLYIGMIKALHKAVGRTLLYWAIPTGNPGGISPRMGLMPRRKRGTIEAGRSNFFFSNPVRNQAANITETLLSYNMLAASVPARSKRDNASTLERRDNLQKEFRSSINLSRQLLRKTRNLTRLYHFDRLSGAPLTLVPHSGLFSLTSLDRHAWLSLSDTKRVSHLAKMLSFYHELVQKLKDYEANREDPKFVSQLEHLGFSLRDLSHHVSYQISLLGLPSEDQPEPILRTPQILQNKNEWRNCQEVYTVLRHLENFLCRATRDFWILKDKAAM
ncbi:hypothetical protein JRQ81_005656 [Phrynocephalus forsythii]|uniref:Uncharacterized protein n=1 Tax=Phrynocephalus forsythii TaxID=171643 RepID=A0A9Q0XGK2_9SAUR|nr:hypothetical protein JRQ81_005656 [Phrynocephalus forsythii]